MANLEQLPAEEDISIVAGDEYQYDVVIQDADGNNLDFTNFSNESLQVRGNDGALQDEYKTSDGTLTTSSNGRVQADFTASQTAAWDNYSEFELEAEHTTDGNKTLHKGYVNIEAEVNQ